MSEGALLLDCLYFEVRHIVLRHGQPQDDLTAAGSSTKSALWPAESVNSATQSLLAIWTTTAAIKQAASVQVAISFVVEMSIEA